jgi:hypothetical protein
MPELTLQQIFDTSTAALLAQGKPALENGRCRYRTADGCKCAVGHLIPDDRYDPAMDFDAGLHVGNSMIRDAVGIDYDERLRLLAQLQATHDGPAGVPNLNWLTAWKDNVRAVAVRFNLNTDVLDAQG